MKNSLTTVSLIVATLMRQLAFVARVIPMFSLKADFFLSNKRFNEKNL